MVGVKCFFSEIKGGYLCTVDNEVVPQEVNEETFQGVHVDGHTNDDVTSLCIKNSDIAKFPDNLGKVFKNVKILKIAFSNLNKISMKNMQKFPNLEKLDLGLNCLGLLEGNLFKFNKKLKSIFANNNPIGYIGPELVDGLDDLIDVNFTNCPIGISYYNKEREPGAIDRLKRELKNFYESRQDFTFKIGPESFKVHKFIFTYRSPTFAAMINEQPDKQEIELTADIPLDIFKGISDFYYKNEPMKNPSAQETFEAAAIFRMERLKNIACEILMEEVTKECSLGYLIKNLDLGEKFQCENLKLKAFEEIKKHFPNEDHLMETDNN